MTNNTPTAFESLPTTFIAKPNCLEKQIIAISGAGDGIGKMLALGLASYGATIILLGRTTEKLEAVYDLIEKKGYPQAAIVPIDFEKANDDDYKTIAESIDNEFGKLDGLIHNAAVLGQRTSMQSYLTHVWETVMKVNVSAPFALNKYCLPLLHKSNNASIMFTSSSVGRQGRAYWGAYAASKAAIENMMQTLADELEETSNIRVNSINPGATRTEMRALAFPAENPLTIKSTEDLLPLYLYCMSDASVGVNGKQFSF